MIDSTGSVLVINILIKLMMIATVYNKRSLLVINKTGGKSIKEKLFLCLYLYIDLMKVTDFHVLPTRQKFYNRIILPLFTKFHSRDEISSGPESQFTIID